MLEERVEADLASGRHADLVPELEAAVTASPLRERLRGQLMLALYRSGRQADALRQYQEARTTLGEELGLEPGPGLRSLETAILAHSSSLGAGVMAQPGAVAPTMGTSAPLPAADNFALPGSLVGRDQPLAQLRAALLRAEAGTRSVVLVSGESGIGKTELVRAATRGRSLLAWGTCVDDAAAGGLWPWSRALEKLARSIGLERARHLAGPDVGLLATIAPSFGRARSRPGTDRDRLLLLDAVDRWLQSVAAAAPVVVVLDDLQWADGSTLSLLDLIARSPEPVALCIIGCYRPGELDEPARAHLPPLATAVEHIELEGLDRNAVEAMVSTVADIPPADLDKIHRRAGGHPVFTRELALVWAKGEPTIIPTAVRDAIEWRVRGLSEPTRRVLEVASLSGNEFHIALVAKVLGAEAADVEAACRTAVNAGLLTGTPVAPRFAHDLYRETIAASVDPARRPRLQLAIGAELEARHLRGAAVNPADVARHFIAATAIDGSARAARWSLAAAAADSATFAFAEAAGQLRRWREAVDDAGVLVDDDVRLQMFLAETDALARGGQTAEARGLLSAARDLARRAGSWARLGEVALAVAQLGAVFSARRDDVVLELEAALAAVGGRDKALEARLAARLARELQHSVAGEMFVNEALDAWAGAPIFAHALAAGFFARAGDLVGASRHMAIVVDLGSWQVERSYAWTGLVRELSVAAIALGDSEMCSRLLADLLPVVASCGVSGAVVAFAGSHAHSAALLSAALGRESSPLFAQARQAYSRLGATGWLTDLDRQEAAAVPTTAAMSPADITPAAPGRP